MKHIVTTHEAYKELIRLAQEIFRNGFLEVYLGCYLAQPSSVPPDTELELFPCNPASANDLCNIDVNTSSVETNPVATNI